MVGGWWEGDTYVQASRIVIFLEGRAGICWSSDF